MKTWATGSVGAGWSPLLKTELQNRVFRAPCKPFRVETVLQISCLYLSTALHHGLSGFLPELTNVDVGRQLEFNWRATIIPGMFNEHFWNLSVINLTKLRLDTKSYKFRECIHVSHVFYLVDFSLTMLMRLSGCRFIFLKCVLECFKPFFIMYFLYMTINRCLKIFPLDL